ncbi:MAG: HDIG domain-containing protein [Candidatus Heimdallarchaeota archaeon]|nr:MAG: HDIG domain-containing protein [Candidatus Heimdallarchaeota archaeon]
MPELPITRHEALELLQKFNKDQSDFIHYLETEAIMRELAKRLGEDVEYWMMLGLLHDVDWGLTKEDVVKHLTKMPQILTGAGFDDDFISTVLSHGYGYEIVGMGDKKRTRIIEHALACAETVTGLIHAYALVRQGKISGMKVKGLKKKFKDKNFAAKVNRSIIRECEYLSLTLDEFFELAINAIIEIREDVGLK